MEEIGPIRNQNLIFLATVKIGAVTTKNKNRPHQPTIKFTVFLSINPRFIFAENDIQETRYHGKIFFTSSVLALSFPFNLCWFFFSRFEVFFRPCDIFEIPTSFRETQPFHLANHFCLGQGRKGFWPPVPSFLGTMSFIGGTVPCGGTQPLVLDALASSLLELALACALRIRSVFKQKHSLLCDGGGVD